MNVNKGPDLDMRTTAARRPIVVQTPLSSPPTVQHWWRPQASQGKGWAKGGAMEQYWPRQASVVGKGAKGGKGGKGSATFNPNHRQSDDQGRHCWKCGSVKHYFRQCPQVAHSDTKKRCRTEEDQSERKRMRPPPVTTREGGAIINFFCA